MRNTILCGDVLDMLATVPDGIVQCCVTSPPYWGLRSYLDNDDPDKPLEMGLEPTPEQYVEKMVAVFREVKRVLRDDGTLWLNLGDSYAGHHGNKRVPDDKAPSNKPGYVENMRATTAGISGLKPKDLVGIPWRVAFALQADGWWLRSDIIWHKPNPMPESVRDRPTKSHEYIFLLSKSKRYFYDADAVREANSSPEQLAHNLRYAKCYEAYDGRGGPYGDGQPGNENNRGIHSRPGGAGRNRRSVFSCPTQFSRMRDDLPQETKLKLVAELVKRGIM